VVRLPAVRLLAVVLVTCRLAVLPAEAIAPLKLLEKGATKEALAGLVRGWLGSAASERSTSQIARLGLVGPWLRWPSQPGGRALFKVLNRLVWHSVATLSIRFCQSGSTAARCQTSRIG
jgi:hypothetical protein